MQDKDVIQHSTKRIKKKIIDFILNNYKSLFFAESTGDQKMEEIKEKSVNQETILKNQRLLKKVEEELRLGVESDKSPRELLSECIAELEEKGFLNCLESTAEQYVYTIKDQKDKLRIFITGELKKTPNGLTFDSIYRRVCSNYDNFFTKDFVFKVIDELFQIGLIYEIAKQTYCFMDNHFMN